MRNALRILAGLLLGLLCLAPMAGAFPVTVYLNDPCGGCARSVSGCGECDILLELSNRLGQALRDYTDSGEITLRYRNVEDAAMLALYREDMEKFEVENPDTNLPVAVVGGPEYGSVVLEEVSGDALGEAIDMAARRKQALGIADAQEEPAPQEELVTLPRNDAPAEIEEGDSTVIYFYKPDCPYCIELKALLHALPLEIPLADGSMSRLRFVALDKNNPEEMDIVQQYYDILEIDEERQFVPMLIVGGKDLFLYEEIVPELLPALFAGEGRSTPLGPLLDE